MINFCRPGQILAEIASNAVESDGDHAWQLSFVTEIARWTTNFPVHPLQCLVSSLSILILETVTFLILLLFVTGDVPNGSAC